MAENVDLALMRAQAEMPDLVKDSTNPHFNSKFIGLPGLLDQVLPVLRKHDLLLLQPPSELDGAPALTTRIVHVPSGEKVEFTSPLLMAKQDAQGHGGAITYMRRYALMSLLGLVADEDDDGNAASAAPTRKRSQPKRADAAGIAGLDNDGGSPF